MNENAHQTARQSIRPTTAEQTTAALLDGHAVVADLWNTAHHRAIHQGLLACPIPRQLIQADSTVRVWACRPQDLTRYHQDRQLVTLIAERRQLAALADALADQALTGPAAAALAEIRLLLRSEPLRLAVGQ